MRSSTTVLFWSFQLFSGLLSLAVATPRLSRSVVHEKRDHIPAEWSHSRKHHATAVLPLRFALAQSNIHAMHEFVNDVAHPESPYYGKHWTAAQVAEKFSPSHDTIQTVRDWLSESGFAPERIHVKKTKSWIELNATVEEAERLLNADYYVYKHASGKEHVGE
jgi:tripeptidyl-peptidase I